MPVWRLVDEGPVRCQLPGRSPQRWWLSAPGGRSTLLLQAVCPSSLLDSCPWPAAAPCLTPSGRLCRLTPRTGGVLLSAGCSWGWAEGEGGQASAGPLGQPTVCVWCLAGRRACWFWPLRMGAGLGLPYPVGPHLGLLGEDASGRTRGCRVPWGATCGHQSGLCRGWWGTFGVFIPYTSGSSPCGSGGASKGTPASCIGAGAGAEPQEVLRRAGLGGQLVTDSSSHP